MKAPQFLLVLVGVLLNAVFLDSLDNDIERRVGIDMEPQTRHGPHGGLEIFLLDRTRRLGRVRSDGHLYGCAGRVVRASTRLTRTKSARDSASAFPPDRRTADGCNVATNQPSAPAHS